MKDTNPNYINVTDFFDNEYVDFASYDNLRKISSVVDGLKNASRKIIYTVLEKNINHEIKVSQLSSKIEEDTEYLHASLSDVLIGMGKTYVGTNNVPLIQKSGNYGTRHIPSASAERYINGYASKHAFALFNKDDNENLISQEFEGNKIEPRFYVPTLPVLLLNGGEGTSPGFKQVILPRNPIAVKKALMNRLDGGRRRANLTPYYEGFKGEIVQGETERQWLIKGVVERVNTTNLMITEIPVGQSLKQYTLVLDALEENKVIVGYEDLSEDDEFKFAVKVTAKSIAGLDHDGLLKMLKLIKTTSEIYTCINHNNKIAVYSGVDEIIDEFLKVKLVFMNARKVSLIKKYNESINVARSRKLFIQNVADETLVISKRTKADIVSEMDAVGDYHKVDDKYNYLLNMPITSLTKEKMDEMDEIVNKLTTELEVLQNNSPEQLLSQDIENV